MRAAALAADAAEGVVASAAAPANEAEAAAAALLP